QSNTLIRNKEVKKDSISKDIPDEIEEEPKKEEKVYEHQSVVNEMIEKFEESLSFKLKGRPTQERAAKSVIKRLGAEKAMDAVIAALACQDAEYAPRIANIDQLDKKLDKLMMYYRSKNNNKQTVLKI